MVPRLRDLLKPKESSRQIASPQAPAAANSTPAETDDVPWDQLFQQAQGLQQQGELERAIELYTACIGRAPGRPEAYYKRANSLNGMGQLEAALEDYDTAISLDTSFAYALCNRGSVLERLGRLDDSLASYDRALVLDPKDSLTHYNRGSVLNGLKRFEEALASYELAIAFNAAYAEAYVNRGNVLQELRRDEAAVESFDRAIALKPTIAQAYLGRASSRHFLKHREQALFDYSKAIELKPDLAAAYLRRGNLLAEGDRHTDAVADYLKATELEPCAAHYVALASSLVPLKRFDLAISSLDEAMACDPSTKYLLGASRSIKMRACRWEGLRADLESIAEGLRERRPICEPLVLAALMDSPELLRSAAEIFVQDQINSSRGDDLRRIAETGTTHFPAPRSTKIRIGYFSADFRTHPVTQLTAGLFERHDRAMFEVTAFAFGPETNDPIVSRLTKAFERFIDVRQKSDFEVVTLARDLGIDIAVDLNGFTGHSRGKIFALRAAPVQIGFLGYPGTIGASFMDYLIADGTVVPRAQRMHYAEKIAYLPGCFLPFDSSYAIADRTFAREELGLPPSGFVFCCFNNSYKILPDVFDRWMRILGRTNNSVLWLQQADATAVANLRREASVRGIDGARLIFAERIAALPEHLARLRAADLFLDTFPYNAHATALDALWVGVPLLTYPGESFASRVAASLLRTFDLLELVASSPSRYEETAVALAADPVRLGQLRRKLALRDTPLFDTERYTQNLEAIYQSMYERHRSGLPPADLNDDLAT
jgi:predicted O-linked N-acetylglucosamine transferase (SPINDLY family)